ncbi:DUF1761 domain-containing protein [Candidatus Saccharibacteria bacterium]|nr:DUF1761 domain-containing protein [Candidatus Saccharibacteria bacterium]
MDVLDFNNLNYWAVVAAVVFNQLLGATWYAAFSRPWMAAVGLSKKDMEAMKGTPRQWYPYLVSVGASILSVTALALLIGGLGVDNFLGGLSLGLLVAVSFVLTANGVNYAFEGRSLKLFLINGGYPLISYGVIGAVLAVWT